MSDIIIRGKSFSEEEILKTGKAKVRKTTNVLRYLGIGLFATGIVGGIGAIIYSPDSLYQGIAAIAIFAIAGGILFGLSFKKRDPFQYGKKEIEKGLPFPQGFDGNFIDVLQSDKEVVLTTKPRCAFYIDTKSMQFQILDNGKYSKIYNPKDLRDFEIRVDDEVVVTANTTNKKSAGKAIAGGLLFGEAGAIAGAVAGNSKSVTTENQKVIHHYSLILKFNDMQKPSFVFNLNDVNVAEEILALLEILNESKEQNQ